MEREKSKNKMGGKAGDNVSEHTAGDKEEHHMDAKIDFLSQAMKKSKSQI